MVKSLYQGTLDLEKWQPIIATGEAKNGEASMLEASTILVHEIEQMLSKNYAFPKTFDRGKPF